MSNMTSQIPVDAWLCTKKATSQQAEQDSKDQQASVLHEDDDPLKRGVERGQRPLDLDT